MVQYNPLAHLSCTSFSWIALCVLITDNLQAWLNDLMISKKLAGIYSRAPALAIGRALSSQMLETNAGDKRRNTTLTCICA